MAKKGDVIDIIFPSTSCTSKQISEIKNYLEAIGLVPRILFEKQTTPRVSSNNSFANFSAEARFKQLYEALKNPESTLVWCGRGGYGSGDLLPLLAAATPIKQNKMFIGFSDITSITTFLQQNWGWKTICAPLPIQMIKSGKLLVNKKSEKEILDLIFGKKSQFEYDLTALNNVKSKNIKAEIVGGCMSVLAGHFGGAFQMNFADKILFLEDVGEEGEKLDRYFRQIVEVVLQNNSKPQAILLGEFCYGIKDKFFKQNVACAIEKLIARIEQLALRIPVFQVKDLGHSSKMRSLILGVKTEINNNKLKLLVSI